MIEILTSLREKGRIINLFPYRLKYTLAKKDKDYDVG
jgi:hypothetical protein